mgnify:CR=1 FL=1
MKQRHKQHAEPARPNVGNEHGTVIITGLREIIQVAFRAPFQHVKRLDKRPASGFKHVAFVATGAFQVNNAIGFASFFKHNDRDFVLQRSKTGYLSLVTIVTKPAFPDEL